MEYTVNPDCTGTTRTLAPDGMTEVASSVFVLVNGGREGWSLDTTGPAVRGFTVKRIDADLDETQRLVRSIASRLGILVQ